MCIGWEWNSQVRILPPMHCGIHHIDISVGSDTLSRVFMTTMSRPSHTIRICPHIFFSSHYSDKTDIRMLKRKTFVVFTVVRFTVQPSCVEFVCSLQCWKWMPWILETLRIHGCVFATCASGSRISAVMFYTIWSLKGNDVYLCSSCMWLPSLRNLYSTKASTTSYIRCRLSCTHRTALRKYLGSYVVRCTAESRGPVLSKNVLLAHAKVRNFDVSLMSQHHVV